MLFKFLNVLLSLLQVPTPITTMKISPKRVSQKNHFTELQPFPGVALVCFKKNDVKKTNHPEIQKRGFLLNKSDACCHPVCAATAVCEFGGGRHSSGPAQV